MEIGEIIRVSMHYSPLETSFFQFSLLHIMYVVYALLMHTAHKVYITCNLAHVVMCVGVPCHCFCITQYAKIALSLHVTVNARDSMVLCKLDREKRDCAKETRLRSQHIMIHQVCSNPMRHNASYHFL